MTDIGTSVILNSISMGCLRARALRKSIMLSALWLLLLFAPAASALDPIPFVRTPDAQFAGLPDYPFAPNYLTVDGDLRMHYLDEGPADGPPVLLIHGEPSWSYLYRKMIPPLVAAGYRVIVPDLIGFGRSDKPTNRSDYTYTRHVNWVEELLLGLDLQDTTLFCQDWGGLIGLRLVAAHSDRFSGVVAANTGLFGGPAVTIGPPDHPRPDGVTFAEWLNYSQTVEVLDVGALIQGWTTTTLSAEEMDAYRAPFPNNDETYLAGARVFPTLVGSETAEGRAAWDVLQARSEPFLTTFSDGDSITWGMELRFIEHLPGAANEPHVIVEDAGHFLQEDKGEELAGLILDFLARNRSDAVGCPPAPQVGCRTSGASLLEYRDDESDARDKLVFKWIRGQATSQGDLADPEGNAQYNLCIYGGQGTTLFSEANVPADPLKWSAISTKGYKYRDRLFTESGTQSIVLRGSDADKAKIIWKGRGDALPDTPQGGLPLQAAWFPIVAQVSNSDTQICFETSFASDDVVINSPDRMKLRQK
jgi:haloalkane dehalogenase